MNRLDKLHLALFIAAVGLTIVILKNTTDLNSKLASFSSLPLINRLAAPAPAPTPITILFEESGNMQSSDHADWWLNSGGEVSIEKNLIKTVQGELPDDNYWRKLYAKNNPQDTDNGYHPQNIFRLVSRDTCQDCSQEVFFKINDYILSDSPNKNASNGVLLFNRYVDGDNLYYTGVRVDGQAVIKKKQNGIYYTMAIVPIFNGMYDRENNPNLLPEDEYIGIKSEIKNVDEKQVEIKFYIKRNDGDWTLVAEATDAGARFGRSPILHSAHAGIRADFMDVEFRDYKLEKI